MNSHIINLMVTDNNIWYKDQAIIEIIKTLLNGDDVLIQLTNNNNNVSTTGVTLEGPCCERIGLYKILDNITTTFGIDKKRITIKTKNFKEKHQEYNIIIVRMIRHKLLHPISNIFQSQALKGHGKNFNENFKHFGCFLNRSNWQRLWIAGHLFKHHANKTKMSFLYSLTRDYHLDFLGVDTLFKKTSDHNLIDQTFNLLHNAPLELDQLTSYPPNALTAMAGLHLHYKNIFVEIVCETFFEGNVFTVTEKLIRPILLKTPFIVQGPPNYLKNVKKLGFKTFDRWWDEIYNDADALPLDQELTWSTKKLLSLIDSLAQMPVNTLKEIYDDMTPTLEYNFNLWLSEYDNSKLSTIIFD